MIAIFMDELHYSKLMIPLVLDDPEYLAGQLVASRNRSTRITCDLEADRLLGPRFATVNPPLWEIGHLAWFQEYWCLRRRPSGAYAPSILPDADKLYDSAAVAHETRWNLPLPDIKRTRGYQADVLERVLRRLTREPEDESLQYFVRLAVAHEDMHAEAFHYTRQTLAYSDPFPDAGAPSEPAACSVADVDLPGGLFRLGAEPADGFVFDNEKWAHDVRLSPFRIARVAVTNADYLKFVEDSGYARRDFWDEEGWTWLQSAQQQAPRYWIRPDDTWRLRRFAHTILLPLDSPVMHVNWHEAQAYCRFARRRLPTEAEWEYAAALDSTAGKKRRYPWGNAHPQAAYANLESSNTLAVNACARGDSALGCRQMLGNVWEWTATTFTPYPGYVVDPYQQYSQPWFGTHKVLRGGSFATTQRLIRNTWRNFYTPDRGDIFAGIRTCAIESAG